jgi:hypothetical protein
MWEDMIFWTAPDAVVALDARTGEMRWEAKTDTRGNSQGAVMAGDKVISGGSCPNHDSCYISAHDGKTGKLLWKFMTAAETGQFGGDTWGDMPDDKRTAATWGLGGIDDNGVTYLNEDLIFTGPNQDKVLCFFNTRSYWAQGYSPVTNSLYVPFVDVCNSVHTKDKGVRSAHDGVNREGSKPEGL